MMKKEIVDFSTFLQDNRGPLIDKWFDLILQSYPPEAARIFKSEKDSFANPVGSSILTALQGLYDALAAKISMDEAKPHLEIIIRIRAVQECRPSQAVQFLPGIKQLVRERSGSLIKDDGPFMQQFLDFTDQVDQFILMALDAYMQNRELIYQLRVDETKSSIFQLLQKNDLIIESQPAMSGDSPVKNFAER